MTEVKGQIGLDEVYEGWSEVPAMGEMTDDQLASDARVDAASYLDPAIPEAIAAEERALVTVQSGADHHIVTGMAALARMTEDEFQSAMTAIEQGQRRMKEFQTRAMTAGEDYGTVAGIKRPFLHLPGAEKLCLLYGFAVRQEAERIDGRRVFQKVGEIEVSTDQWETPPLSYHVKSYFHLGSFDGPIVAMGYGEANSWETKYRYSMAESACPNCGRPGLVKRKSPPAMAGKWNCPSWQDKGGCNATFEPNDPRIQSGAKIENPDPYSLAETLIQMAAKRSLVAGTRRATGTSGLFTQDEDSPSVIAQSGGDDDHSGTPEPQIAPAPAGTQVSRGGKDDHPTGAQIALLGKISKEKDLGPDKIAEYAAKIDLTFPTVEGDRGAKGRAMLEFIKTNVTADQFGALLHLLDTGDLDAVAATTKETA